jgi:beta-glucosidase
VVQLYLRVNTSGVTRPAQQLAGFARVELEPGRSRRVTFEVASTQLGYTNAEGVFAVEPAAVDFFLGLASDHCRIAGSYIVAGAPRTLTSSDDPSCPDR